MSHAPSLRKMLWVILAGWAGSSGCIHNHYYGAIPGCPPGTQVVTTQVGPVCEIPGEPGTLVASGGLNSNVVVQTPAPGPAVVSTQPRVIFSQPAYQPTFGDSLSSSVRRFEKWRRPDPETGLASIRAEGGLDDGAIKR